MDEDFQRWSERDQCVINERRFDVVPVLLPKLVLNCACVFIFILPLCLPSRLVLFLLSCPASHQPDCSCFWSCFSLVKVTFPPPSRYSSRQYRLCLYRRRYIQLDEPVSRRLPFLFLFLANAIFFLVVEADCLNK